MRNILLKILSVLSFAAVVFPFMFSIDINTFGNVSVLRMLYYFAVGAAVFGIGYLEAAFTKVHKKLRIPLRIAGILTFGAGFAALLIGGDGVTVFALGSCCVFAFFIGERACYKNFADMFPLAAFATYIVLTLGCYIFASTAANEEIRSTVTDTVIASFAIEFTAAALLVNQSGIFDRANMRKETRSSLPKGLTAYNAALILGFTVTGLAFTVFRKQIVWLLQQMIRAVVMAVFFIIKLFTAERMTTEIPEEGELGTGLYSENHIPYLIEALFIIAVITLIIVFRKRIFAAIKVFFARLGALLSGRPEVSQHPEFTDVFEDYSTDRSRRAVRDNIYAVKRRYAAEKDPAKKYRLGYRLLLFRIKAVNQRLTPADTVSVQTERGAARFGHDELAAVASVYEDIRYNNAVPTDSQLSALSELTSRQ